MNIEKVDQTFTLSVTFDEGEARALQGQIARARRILLEQQEKTGKTVAMVELEEFMKLLTHQIPSPWKPKGA
ncbi:MAG: hypothetical protein KAV87_19485 [Desulfobacteraceae bacterium]|nr:hypothetical protein [Desulfobacteraceae bacterium]